MSSERGQTTVEWTALLLLVVVVLSGAFVAIDRFQAFPLIDRIRCTILFAASCEEHERSELEAVYGDDVAKLVRRYTPNLAYEKRMLSLPVDFRECREHICADGPDRRGQNVAYSARGRKASVFTHVVDRRKQGGDLFIQYWLYYPDSTWHDKARSSWRIPGKFPLASKVIKGAIGKGGSRWVKKRWRSYHKDDWESYQVRIGKDGRVRARASAHHGYTGRKNWRGDINQIMDFKVPIVGTKVKIPRSGQWTDITGWTHVTRGSHAGFLVSKSEKDQRYTRAPEVSLIPAERLAKEDRALHFSSGKPPWAKRVYNDPEHNGT